MRISSLIFRAQPFVGCPPRLAHLRWGPCSACTTTQLLAALAAAGGRTEGSTKPSAQTAHRNGSSSSSSKMPALPEPTIIDAVLSDHRNAVALMQRCMQALREGDWELGCSLTTAIAVEVLLHSAAEEAVLYPFVEARLGEEGKHFSKHSLHEHQELEHQLLAAVLAAREGDRSSLADLVADIHKAFEHHQHDEEDRYLPNLAQHAQQGELRELSVHWAAAKQNARLGQLSGSLQGGGSGGPSGKT